jgi:cellulose synthase (UDP-forming)
MLVTWLQSGGFRVAAIVVSIGAAPVHVRALWSTLRNRDAKWNVTNQAGGGGRSLWVVMPHIALLAVNITAIVVGLVVMTDPPPTLLCVGWASMHVLILGRMIAEALTSKHTSDDQADRDGQTADEAGVPAVASAHGPVTLPGHAVATPAASSAQPTLPEGISA